MNLDRRLLGLLRDNPTALLVNILAGSGGALVTIAQAGLLSRVVSQVFIAHQPLAEVQSKLLVLLAVIAMRAALTWLGDGAASQLAISVKTGLRRDLYGHLQRLGPGYLKGAPADQQRRTGNLVHLATEGVEALDAYYRQYLPQLFLSGLVPCLVALAVLSADRLSALVLILTGPLIPFFMLLIGQYAGALTQKRWALLSRMSAHFLDVLQGLTTLKAFGRSRTQSQVIAQVGESYRQATMGVLRVSFLSALVLEWLAMLSTALVAVEIGLRLLAGSLAFEQGFFVLLLAGEFYLPLRQLGMRFHAGMAGVSAGEQIFSILETDPLPATSSSIPCTASPTSPNPPLTITFERVTFAYEPGRPALEQISTAIPAGQTVALVGSSGAGKSTLADLLLGFIAPQEGHILVNGIPLPSIPLDAWRSQVAWVPQRPYLFAASVAENIRLARPAAGMADVIAAALLAGAHEFIMQLPAGYETPIGERGTLLSAGQAQRIALARAYLADAPLLILDEATTNLDPEVAEKIYTSLTALSAGRTTLVIAHRLQTVQHADRIIVLEEGRIVEAGTYRQLASRDGPFHRLIAAHTQPHLPGEPAQPVETLLGAKPTNAPSPIPPNAAPTPIPGKPVTGQPALPPPFKLASARDLLRLLARYKWQVLLSVFLGWTTIASGVGLLATAAYLISAAALQPSIAALQVPITGVRFFGLARGALRYLERLTSHDTTFRLLSQLRLAFYRALEPLAPARLTQFHSGDLLARIQRDITALEDFYVRAVAPPLVWLLVSLTVALFLAQFSILVALAQMAFLVAGGLILPAGVRLASRKPRSREADTRATLYESLVDGIQGMADLQSCRASGRHTQAIDQLGQHLARIQLRLGRIDALQSAGSSLLAYLAAWTVLALCITPVMAGEIEGVYLAMLVLAALASFECASPLPAAASALENSLAAARRLGEVITAQPEVSDPPDPLPVPKDYRLAVRNLSFVYPQVSGEANPVSPAVALPGVSFALQGIHLDLAPGERLAIVGPSGAGKTTLANLLMRFWDYRQGEILLGGQDLRGYRQEELRARISLVTQHTHLFNTTVYENLRLARPDASREEIVRAAETARIHPLIASLPDGYDTWIGEQGLRLSAGERQRLAIARALLKDAPLLILDEPTANLDALVEQQILAALLSLMAGRSTLLITHRLVGMETMDQIVVLAAGRVVERGRHRELLASKGVYRRLWAAQNMLLT